MEEMLSRQLSSLEKQSQRCRAPVADWTHGACRSRIGTPARASQLVCSATRLSQCLKALKPSSAKLHQCRHELAGLFAAALVCLPCAQAAAEDGLTIRFKASKDPAIREVQEALVQTWGYVTTQYLDTTFNQVDWPAELQAGIDESFASERPEDVYKVIDGMLKKLGDPFTRVIPPSTADVFQNMTEGQIVSLGFQVAEDQTRIIFVANGSPADQSGVRIGDRLLSVNGRKAQDFGKQELAALLRTEADIVLERQEEGAAEPQSISLHLKARPMEVHPVQYAVLNRSEDERKAGYIRLAMFSKNAARDVEGALKKLKDEDVSSVVLDLRDNAGGVVFSGYEVAQLFLPEGAEFCYVEDGRGASEDVKLAASHQLTDKPMIVLVNGGTASTAELIAASLHDNHRAALVGEKTFGKGRTQRVVQLKGGGLLLLSNTMYLTPQHQQVDKVGLSPDVACKPEDGEQILRVSSGRQNSSDLLEDSCIQLAVELSQSGAQL